jgi:hypothetical protein
MSHVDLLQLCPHCGKSFDSAGIHNLRGLFEFGWNFVANAGPSYELLPIDIAAAGGVWIGRAVTGEIIGIGGARGAAGGLPLLTKAGGVGVDTYVWRYKP